ncbi:MAG: tRNA (uracil-5-)-methyltransferase [Eubacteriaceae bacterium]|nr:tRNA (uracil-5-)-methyltransferase [Eubacteriaceae bacterium]
MDMKKSKKKKIIICIGLAVVCLVAAGVLAYHFLKPVPDNDAAYIDGNAKDWDDGAAAAGTAGDTMQVPGYDSAVMNAGDTNLAIKIGNPEENTCYLKATLMLEDGTVLFESGLMEPGKGYDSVPLSQSLGTGEYKAYVKYQGYSMDDAKKPLNSSESAFTLTVQ